MLTTIFVLVKCRQEHRLMADCPDVPVIPVQCPLDSFSPAKAKCGLCIVIARDFPQQAVWSDAHRDACWLEVRCASHMGSPGGRKEKKSVSNWSQSSFSLYNVIDVLALESLAPCAKHTFPWGLRALVGT